MTYVCSTRKSRHTYFGNMDVIVPSGKTEKTRCTNYVYALRTQFDIFWNLGKWHQLGKRKAITFSSKRIILHHTTLKIHVVAWHKKSLKTLMLIREIIRYGN